MNTLLRSLLLTVFCFYHAPSVFAQTNDTPGGNYKWKKNKTEMQDGYVILKSGKKMNGQISLKGSPGNLEEISFEGEGKEIDFPAGALKAYGLTGSDAIAREGKSGKGGSSSSANGPINDSPESLYEWNSLGVVMNKQIDGTTPRPGYVILRDGTRYDGELRLKKKDGVLDVLEVKLDKGKEKFEPGEVGHYGYTVSKEEVAQENLADEGGKELPGAIHTASGKISGTIKIQPSGKPYTEQIIFQGTDGKYKEHTPSSIKGFSVNNNGETTNYTVIQNVFVEEGYNGTTFQLYLNPNPTTVNERATSFAKGAAQLGTTAIASEISRQDQKRNDYTSNMDSIIRVSSKEELVELRESLAKLGGYSSADEAQEKTDNESLKNNLVALDLAITSREIGESEGAIMQKEWIIFNKKSGEKTIVYKQDFDKQIEVLLFGCDKYLELSKSEQNELAKWKNLNTTLAFIDGCY